MLRMAEPFLPGVLVGLAAIVLVYSLALRASRTWLSNALGRRFFGGAEKAGSENRESLSGRLFHLSNGVTGPGMPYTVALAIGLGVLGLFIAESDKAQDQPVVRLVRTSPLWKRVASRPMSREKFLSSAAALGLGQFGREGTQTPGKAPRDLNVLVVFMESSYNKHLSLFGGSEETQPLLAKYKDRMELFPNFFSAFTGSIHARFATFTSLYPVRDFDTFTQERVPVKSLFEIFHDQGYSCSMFYSSYFDYTGFRDFLKNRGLDEMYDADTMPGQRGTERVAWGLLEEETLGAIRNQLKKYAQAHQHFCLTYVPAAPHYPYDRIPKPFQKHKMEEVGDFTPLYLNELLYMDWVIASIIDELKESGLLDNTLVVITNDHGEMVGGKDGHLGHGWAVTPQLANTPLILMDPERTGFQINQTVGTQVDLLPTILDRLHIAIPADQLYEGVSLDAGSAREGRIGYLNSFKEFGIISGNQVLLGDRESSEPSGVASQGAVFTISNDGSKTIFTEAEQTGTIQDRQATMAHFDAFQESLLRNYAAYCASVLAAPQKTLAKRAEH
jgi:arylsulfatase A-like enzyme